MAEKELDQLTREEKKARFQKAFDDYNSGFVEVDYTKLTSINTHFMKKYYKDGSSLFRVGNCIISLRNFFAPVHSLPSEIMTS